MTGEGLPEDDAREAMGRLTENLRGVTEKVHEGIAEVRREISALHRAELDRHVMADHPDLDELGSELGEMTALFADDPPA